jgi:hypothetical protein
MDYPSLEVWGAGGPPTMHMAPYSGPAVTEKRKVFYTPESRALQQCKNDIDRYYQEGKWDDYKKITNPYEYIFLSWNRRSSRSVATRQPLSRSYFKMIEMWKRLELSTFLHDLIARDGGLVTAHAAEGPGGFIEACAIMSSRNSWTFNAANAITLRSEAKNVPGWRKAGKFLSTYPQVCIHDGHDGTGNILIKENQDAFVTLVREKHPHGVHLFTADGGFDFSNDYNAQEDAVLPLLIAETLLGLRVLSKGGCLVIKCFDTTEQPTLDLIWLISRAFCSWGVIKPRTSRAGNAERYIIGKGYLGESDDIIALLEEHQLHRISNTSIPLVSVACDSYKSLVTQLSELQEKIEHIELSIIRDTLDLIKSTEQAVIKCFVRANVHRSIDWCKEHEEEIAPYWMGDFEKHLNKETQDLLHILNPPPQNTITYGTWHTRSTMTSHISFEGFRAGTLSAVTPEHNPFMRLKKTPHVP